MWFRRKKAKIPDQVEICIGMFVLFYNASRRSWEEAEEFLVSHPEILNDSVMDVILAFAKGTVSAEVSEGATERQRATRQQFAAEVQEKFAVRADLLKRSKEVGVRRAIAEFKADPGVRGRW